jgi:heme/copper-type cytochrome/quinol oxidase subunit 2
LHADAESTKRPRLPGVVTKKRRRSQLARAGAQRQQIRRAERQRRRRVRQRVLTAVVVVLLVAGLVTWIALHARDSASASAAPTDYASVVDQPTTAGGAR